MSNDNLGFHIPNIYLGVYQSELLTFRESRLNLVFNEGIEPVSDFIPLNEAEGYGYLRVMESDKRPTPRDVVIYEALPNELPRVAGIITTAPQTPLSHVNLRAQQDRVPNAFIRDAVTDFASFIDGFVYFKVTAYDWELRDATLAEVNGHYESLWPPYAQYAERDLSIREITPFSDIGFEDWNAFGVKAANVAVLGTFGFPDGTVPDGFGIPFYFYDEFMKHNDFYARIQTMFANSGFQTDPEVQDYMLDELRDDIEDAETPQWIVDAIVEMNTGSPTG